MRIGTVFLFCLTLMFCGCGADKDADTPKKAAKPAASETTSDVAATESSSAPGAGQAVPETGTENPDDGQQDPPDPETSENVAASESPSATEKPDEPVQPRTDPPAPAGDSDKTPAADVASAPPSEDVQPSGAAAGGTEPAPGAANAATQTDISLAYVDSGFVGGIVAKPRQVMQSKLGRTVIENVFDENSFGDLMSNFEENFGVRLQDVEQVAVLVSEKTIAKMAGVTLPSNGDPAMGRMQLMNNLKQIALGFHNYHDAHQGFPETNDNLSWRVHILPYLEQSALYERFALDEPWDSDTNKPLIAEMPEVFRTPGVEAAGKTSVHVFVGEDAPFENAISFRNIVDGTSNTILTALAAPDTAAEWTKPGGLKIDPDNPWKSFGELPDGPLMVGMMDGAVTTLARDTDEELVRALLTHAGSEPIDPSFRSGIGNSAPDPAQNPTLIAHCTAAIDQGKAVRTLGEGFGEPKKKKGNGKEYYDVGGYAIWFPDEKTVVATQTKLLPRLMSNRDDESKLRRLLKAGTAADLIAIADTEGMPTMFSTMMEGAPVPALSEITGGVQTMNVSLPDQPFFRIEVTVSNEQSATGLLAMANGSLAMVQQQIAPANVPPPMASWAEMVSGLVRDVQVTRDGSKLIYEVPKPKDYDGMINGLVPQLKELGESVRGAQAAAQRMQEHNRMRQIGLAFHNHHSVYNSFGAADGSTEGGRKSGLSWRVHLLPFLEEAELYAQFKVGEPWDSDQNKKLIAKMPEIFKVKGVDEVGKTSIHVFTGKGAPFGDGTKEAALRDFTDGSSNTVLAVEAGPDTAEIWTKPGGLKFDAERPRKVLGKIGDTFRALFADGFVRSLPADIDEGVLGNLITHQDGVAVDPNEYGQ